MIARTKDRDKRKARSGQSLVAGAVGPLGIPLGEVIGRLLKGPLTPEAFPAAFAGVSAVFDAGIGSEEIIESHRGRGYSMSGASRSGPAIT